MAHHTDRIIITAHGQPSDPGPQEAHLHDLGAKVGAVLGQSVIGCTLAAPGAFEKALAGSAAPLIYPLFMADGWFTRQELPRRLKAAGIHNARQMAPFGADPRLAEVIISLTGDARRLLLAGHGSQRAPQSSATCEAMAERLRASGAYDQVVTGYVEQEPWLSDVARDMKSGVCLPFFALEASHVTHDIPKALRNAGFDGPQLPPLGRALDAPALIARAIQDALAATNG